MADAVIDLEATNVMNMDAEFKTQSSSVSVPSTNANVKDKDGNISCRRNIVDLTTYNQTSAYCGTNLYSDLLNSDNWVFTLGSPLLASVPANLVPNSLTINMTAAGYVTVDMVAHEHAVNKHTTGLHFADIGSLLSQPFLSWDGFGIPAFGVESALWSPTSATMTFALTHVDQIKENGDHLVGNNTSLRMDLTVDYVGDSTGLTIANIQAMMRGVVGYSDIFVDSLSRNDSNAEFDTFSFSSHVNISLT